MAELVYLVVAARVLLDVRVRARQVRLGLVVVEVADEVLDGVVREELTELGVELGREGLVVSQDEGGLLVPFYDLGNRVGLTGAGYAQQRLMAQAFGQAVAQLLDGGRLVAGRLEVGNEPKLRHLNLVSVGLSIPCDEPLARAF